MPALCRPKQRRELIFGKTPFMWVTQHSRQVGNLPVNFKSEGPRHKNKCRRMSSGNIWHTASTTEVQFSTGVIFAPSPACPSPGTFGIAWGHFWLPHLGDATSLQQAEAQNPAEHSTMYRAAPHKQDDSRNSPSQQTRWAGRCAMLDLAYGSSRLGSRPTSQCGPGQVT